jgi:hypothetical protein
VKHTPRMIFGNWFCPSRRRQCPIGAAGSPERKHADMTLKAIIRPALAECGIAFDVKRGDESAEIGMITDHVIAENTRERERLL